MNQVELTMPRQHIDVDVEMVIRQPSFGAALNLCQTLGAVSDQEVCHDLDIDVGVWSRIKRTGDSRYKGQRGHMPHDKLVRFMELCGNDAPTLWLLHSRGMDPRSIRPYQTESEALAESYRQQNEQLKNELDVIKRFMSDTKRAG